MKNYTAVVEIHRRADAVSSDDVDALMTMLEEYSPAVGGSPRGWLELRFSLPALTLAQATTTALALANRATAEYASSEVPIACQLMTEEEFDARQGFVTLPSLIGTAEVAEILGVSRQRVGQLVQAGQLQAMSAGKNLAFARHEVEQFANRDRRTGRPVKR